MFGFDNYEQWKAGVENIVKGLLSRSRNITVKHIKVEQVAIPEQSTTNLEGTDTQGGYVQFYNTTREQFEIWQDGEFIRKLG